MELIGELTYPVALTSLHCLPVALDIKTETKSGELK
jgi:hypothetical protein